jgi:hypothetical protein
LKFGEGSRITTHEPLCAPRRPCAGIAYALAPNYNKPIVGFVFGEEAQGRAAAEGHRALAAALGLLGPTVGTPPVAHLPRARASCD